MNNVYYDLAIICLFSISMTEILTQKGFLNIPRDELKEWSIKVPHLFVNILMEWLNCEVCSTAQTMYAIALYQFFVTQNYQLSLLTAVLAQPLGMFMAIAYKNIK